MKLLHITPHLGGGVGKAHAEVCSASDGSVDRTFVLLEEPRDRRFADRIIETGAQILSGRSAGEISNLAAQADIVQFEFWNHPKIYEILARTSFPAMRSLFWCHISGLFAPFIAPGLLTSVDRFVFTSPCSFQSPAVAKLSPKERRQLHAIGSGFGFETGSIRKAKSRETPKVGYLGTVDFVKMHPDFFTIIDNVEGPDFEVLVWGNYAIDGDIATAHQQMRHPQRVRLMGHCSDPKSAMSDMDIFLYPLQVEHYGTAENALIEAMSLGVAPVVLANPAEQAIVKQGITGFVAASAEDCSQQLGQLLQHPDLVFKIGSAAQGEVQASHVASRSASLFQSLYVEMMQAPKRVPQFRSAIGSTPVDWFLSTQSAEGAKDRFLSHKAASKGSVAHFLDCFPDDPELLALL